MRTSLAVLLLVAGATTGGLALARTGGGEAAALALAKRQSSEAELRSLALQRAAAAAASQAARARAEAAALAARIDAAEADITASEARLKVIERRRTEQRELLATRQQPLVRLTAALQTMSRRPPALALVQPGSVDDVVHLRSLLASTLPVIRARTAALRTAIEAETKLREQARIAAGALAESQQALKERRIALARFEGQKRSRSAGLQELALDQSDRALAFNEEARDLAERAGTRRYQIEIRERLTALPAPLTRPVAAPAHRPGGYLLPIVGDLVRGTGEISNAGIHARGMTFASAPGGAVFAPAAGRIAYAAPFRGYGRVVIIDHGRGLATVLTNLDNLSVSVGSRVAAGAPIGRVGEGGRISVELRLNGRPYPIARLLALG